MVAGHYKINVKTLVESVHRRGDLSVRTDEATDAREGIRAQRQVQQGRGDTYQREVAITHRFEGHGLVLDISGRADGCILEPPRIEVEEFKATRTDPSAFTTSQTSVHWAQLESYGAALGAAVEGCREVKLRLIYVHPDTLDQHAREHTVSLEVLTRRLTSTCDTFAAQVARMLAHRKARDEDLGRLRFPFGQFRPVQRRLANAVYRAFRDQQHLLAEAPTGGGKTLGCIFPGLKALAEGHLDRVVVLSSRTTGQRAVEEGVDLCMTGSPALRPITITAKDKVCLQQEMNCDPDVCRYAAGYYDRRDDAVRQLLDCRTRLDAERITKTARAHTVCPFELSLDVAQWCDVIIGDYNYVFDPIVRLNRLRGPIGDRTAVLVDEAHQLGDRVRTMLSTAVTRAELKAAADSTVAPMQQRIKALDRCLLDLRRQILGRSPGKDERFDVEIPLPERFTRAIDQLLDVSAGLTDGQRTDPFVLALLWSASRYKRALDWLPDAARTFVLRGVGRGITLEIRAIDPAPHIAATLEDYHASLRFSATLTPLALTNRQHGLPEQPELRLPSAFKPSQLGVFAVPDISTLYRDRRRSLDALVETIERCIAARGGNYLVVFPSFAYLAEAATRFEQRHVHRKVFRQQPSMTDQERKAFLDAFRAANRDAVGNAQPQLGFVVMGGIFAESVDLPGDALIGMIIVGIGLPPPDLERQCIARTFEPEGRAVAFDQPAMTRVVQAAGRLLRTESDRAVLCLVDPRYLDARYRAYFPTLWDVRVTPSASVASALHDFWQKTG